MIPRKRPGREVIRVQGRYYILASSALADDRVRILKHGETFAVFDRAGDVHPLRFGEQGLYHEGTRHLSRLELRVERLRPFLLSSSVLEDNTLLAVDLTNADVLTPGRVPVPRNTLHVLRTKFLHDRVCHERLRVVNFGLEPLEVELSLAFDADFADIFEVRGTARARRGVRLPDRLRRDGVDLSYRGLDGVVRRTEARWRLPPGARAVPSARPGATFRLRLGAQESRTIRLSFACRAGGSAGGRRGYDRAHALALEERRRLRAGECRVETSDERLNEVLERSYADLHMMTTRLKDGPYPYAGVPWFSAVFGRDGLLTAWSCLWMNPGLARGVLEHLARFQAETEDPARDAEPGKILHEMRRGEMAALGEIPFGLYYGSVDSTPLFAALAAAYWESTGDRTFARALWPRVERALEWIERWGDADGDGFVEYGRKTEAGLANQGWKDSGDSVFHADGALARAPIALCEVQGYAYDAYRRGSAMAAALGHGVQARALKAKAEVLRARFEAAFWRPKLGLYALALDARKRPCDVRASNAGHCLFSGIARPDRARRIAAVLTGPDFFTGWGVRTLAAGEPRYNPMSYHDGSVWPHDNALIAAGMARYGHKREALAVLQGIFDAGRFLNLRRLPELFCGFPRRRGEGPTLYPVACSPQSWASAAPFLLLQAVLGLRVEGGAGRVVFDRPALPDSVDEVVLRGLSVGRGSVDVALRRDRREVGVNILRRRGAVEVLVTK